MSDYAPQAGSESLPPSLDPAQDPLTIDTIRLLRAQEQLRQERETFNQRMAERRQHAKHVKGLAWLSAIGLPAVGTVCGRLALDGSSPENLRLSAFGVLAGEIVGVFVLWFRQVAKDRVGADAVNPVTRALPDSLLELKKAADRTSPENAIDSKIIRAWALQNDISVPTRGRLPSAVVDQWRASHGSRGDA